MAKKTVKELKAELKVVERARKGHGKAVRVAFKMHDKANKALEKLDAKADKLEAQIAKLTPTA